MSHSAVFVPVSVSAENDGEKQDHTPITNIVGKIKEVKPNKFKCMRCEKCFKNERYAMKHWRKNHSDDGETESTVCPVALSSNTKMQDLLQEYQHDDTGQNNTAGLEHHDDEARNLGVVLPAKMIEEVSPKDAQYAENDLKKSHLHELMVDLPYNAEDDATKDHDCESRQTCKIRNAGVESEEQCNFGKEVGNSNKDGDTNSEATHSKLHESPVFEKAPSESKLSNLGQSSGSFAPDIGTTLPIDVPAKVVDLSYNAEDDAVINDHDCESRQTCKIRNAVVESEEQCNFGKEAGNSNKDGDTNSEATDSKLHESHIIEKAASESKLSNLGQSSGSFAPDNATTLPIDVPEKVGEVMLPNLQVARDEYNDQLVCASVAVNHEGIDRISDVPCSGAEQIVHTAGIDEVGLECLEVELCNVEVEPPMKQLIKGISSSKFKCMLCGKCFKDQRHAEKHLTKSHPDAVTSDVARSLLANIGMVNTSLPYVSNMPIAMAEIADSPGLPAIQGGGDVDKVMSESHDPANKTQDADESEVRDGDPNDLQIEEEMHSGHEPDDQTHDSTSSIPSMKATFRADLADKIQDCESRQTCKIRNAGVESEEQCNLGKEVGNSNKDGDTNSGATDSKLHESHITEKAASESKLSNLGQPDDGIILPIDVAAFHADFADKIKEVSLGKFKCLVCSRCFKDPRYVWKHLRKSHPELMHTDPIQSTTSVLPQLSEHIMEESSQNIHDTESIHLEDDKIIEDAIVQKLDATEKQIFEIASRDVCDEKTHAMDNACESEHSCNSSQSSSPPASSRNLRLSKRKKNDSSEKSASLTPKPCKRHRSQSGSTPRTPEGNHLNQEPDDVHGPSRSESPSKANQAKAKKHRNTICWSGRACSRRDCFFKHPSGRRIDERGSCPADGRRTSPSGRRQRQRDASTRRQREPSTPRQGQRSRRQFSESPRCHRRQRNKSTRQRERSSRRRQQQRSATRNNCRKRHESSPRRKNCETPRHRHSSKNLRKRSRGVSSSRRSPSHRRRKCATAMDCAAPLCDNSHAELLLQKSPKPENSNTFELACSNPLAISFRQFVEREIDSDAAPGEAVAKYRGYIQKLMKQTLEQLKDTSLLFDMYHPKALIEQYVLRISSTQCLARQFVMDMQNQHYVALRLVTSDVCQAFDDPTTLCRIGHRQAPQFAFDPNVNSLLLCNVPPTVSVIEILQSLRQLPGFVAASAPQLQQDRISRELRVRFETEEFARSVATNGADTPLKSKHPLNFSAIDSSLTLEASVAAPAFSNIESIAKDAELSAQVVRKLDGLCNIPPEISNLLLSYNGTPEQKLDLQVLYLRRVHHFCFYSCQWCVDEWDLCRRCGPAVLRSHLATKEESSDEVRETHIRRLESFVSNASLPKPTLPSSEGAEFRIRLESEVATKIGEIAPTKFKCMLCDKLFKDLEFVQKHLHNKHPELHEIVFGQVCEDVVAAAYLNDWMRPGWPSPRPSNTDVKEASV